MRIGRLFGFLLLLPISAQADNWADEKDYSDLAASKRICAQFRAVALPDPHRQDQRPQGGMSGCSSEALYYMGRPGDAPAAFACAQREAADEMFGGDMMLMTLYANGKGTPRDLDKAIALACTLGGAPMEIHSRVQNLFARRGNPSSEAEFEWCDDITSGYAMGACASHDQRMATARRELKFKALKARWPQAEAANKLEALIKSAEAFAGSRAAEVDQSGTARAAMVVAAEEEVMELLLEDLNHVATNAPALTQALSDSAADSDLNQVYKKVMAGDFEEFAGTPTRDGIKSVQRQWLKYRDAWIGFFKLARPEGAPQAMLNLQTRHRVAQLQELLP
ncbi:lysozyme inhibitor LprI family protein [Magnetospirillum sulfuroxidans]|uniref:DUF1311 domain-containing protein n=1 Tax=Magnetospirillum sulfuroxidans TaxID=611300 RepID=A0ABS5I9A8_9PROT|nr:lysozyme inhibitor LprI family protein [Magnetospirillum sulfuroxidans]MBR9970278.1 DUF1311 domain-containing protein [Magnetospirillum sulfuroxidans]